MLSRIVQIKFNTKKILSHLSIYAFALRKKGSSLPEGYGINQAEPNFTELTDRSLLIVAGPETKTFIQGLTTNNVSVLYPPTQEQVPSPSAKENESKRQERVAIYSLFLSPKGKVISDAFIVRPFVFEKGKKKLVQNQLWIDVSNDTITNLQEHLSRYTWKKKIMITNLRFDEQKPDLYAGFSSMAMNSLSVPSSLNQLKDKGGLEVKTSYTEDANNDPLVEEQGYANLVYYDPRNPKLGIRMICGRKSFTFQGKMKKSNIETYNKMALLSGVSQSSTMKGKLPFMFNTDLLNGFSFRKGCYLGQQIIARAYFTGIVRRRILPVIFESQEQQLPVGTIVYGDSNLELGKVVESYKGFASIQCQYLPFVEEKSEWPMKVESPVKGSLGLPFEDELDEYLRSMREKQSKLEEIDL